MRTNEEIIARIEAIKDADPFGFRTSDLIFVLPFEAARPYLKPEVTAEEWKPDPRDRDSVIAVMLDYMPFAWEKAVNERGLSAYRSMCHYDSWIWLAGDDFGDMLGCDGYGKDNLRKICSHYGWCLEEMVEK